MFRYAVWRNLRRLKDQGKKQLANTQATAVKAQVEQAKIDALTYGGDEENQKPIKQIVAVAHFANSHGNFFPRKKFEYGIDEEERTPRLENGSSYQKK